MTILIDVPKDVPVLLGIPSTDDPNCKTWKVWCPNCREWHTHGAIEGYRAAHCRGSISKAYYIMAMDKTLAHRVKSKAKSYGRRPMGNALRFSVFKRDNFTCQYCGNKPSQSELMADHKISVKNGGQTTLENLTTACSDCNAGKGSSNVE
jgi:hypothetical protein